MTLILQFQDIRYKIKLYNKFDDPNKDQIVFSMQPDHGLYYPKKNFNSFSKLSRLLTRLRNKPFENLVGKGENAWNQHFLLFQPFFYPSQNKFQFFSYIYFVVCKCFQSEPA